MPCKDAIVFISYDSSTTFSDFLLFASSQHCNLDPEFFCACRGERSSQTRKHWGRELSKLVLSVGRSDPWMISNTSCPVSKMSAIHISGPITSPLDIEAYEDTHLPSSVSSCIFELRFLLEKSQRFIEVYKYSLSKVSSKIGEESVAYLRWKKQRRILPSSQRALHLLWDCFWSVW